MSFHPPESNDEKGDYTQCLLKNGNISQVAWIPSRFAVHGKAVSIKNDTKSGKWTVVIAYSTCDRICHAPSVVRSHRKRTGDSLPKKKAT